MIVSEFKNETIRERIFTNYRIINRIKEDKMEIDRIIHNPREFNQKEQ